MERAPGPHHLSRRPAQSADDRICHPEDRCNTGRKPHVEPFAVLSLSLFGDLTQIALCASASFTLILYVHSRQKVRSTVTARPQASVCRLGDCFLRPDFRAPLSLLARPDDARDPEHLARLQRALDMRGSMERSLEFCRAPLERLHHHLARRGLEHHAVAAADGHGGQDRMSDGNLVRLWEL